VKIYTHISFGLYEVSRGICAAIVQLYDQKKEPHSVSCSKYQASEFRPESVPIPGTNVVFNKFS